MGRRWLPLLLAALGAVPALAGDSVPDPAGGVGCSTLNAAAYETIPRLFYQGRADSLLTLLDRWEQACEPDEVIRRTRLLGAIWDGAFDESLYGEEIMDDLVRRGAEFRDRPPATPARAAYDSFTVDLADQLLPHQPFGTPEEFFCLYYSGRTAAAWALVTDGWLDETDLAYYRARKLTLLQSPRRELRVAVTGGLWVPTGELEFVGEKALVGLLVGWWEELWFGRLVGEWRPGRTGRPYWVEREGKLYLSDRWNAVLLGGEIGRRVAHGDGWRFDAFASLGVDMVKPLGGDDRLLATIHGSIGCGYRRDFGAGQRWYAGVDLRAEAIGDRNAEAVNLGGDAWSVRLAVGRRLNGSQRQDLSLLGR